MIEMQVALGDRSYPIYIGPGGLSNQALFEPHIRSKKVMIVSNETVSPLYETALRQTLTGYDVDSVILPDGEQYKNWETLNLIFDALLEKKHSRNTTIIALGGGVVGDMAGFAAASYQRGVDFIQVPTTLLSQVDSSVGGKTGINHPKGKNMVGAFYQPKAVIIDTDTLQTLPQREVSAGVAEIIKYGLIRDYDFFVWLEENIGALMNLDAGAVSKAIEVSCRCKARVVEEDERESGARALLNLGHTFGHAIEAYCGYGTWLHGEAVGAGMMMAARLSYLMSHLSEEQLDRVKNILMESLLPIDGPEGMLEKDYIDLMLVDKKAVEGKIRFVLLKDLGDAYVTDQYEPSLLSKVLS